MLDHMAGTLRLSGLKVSRLQSGKGKKLARIVEFSEISVCRRTDSGILSFLWCPLWRYCLWRRRKTSRASAEPTVIWWGMEDLRYPRRNISCRGTDKGWLRISLRRADSAVHGRIPDGILMPVPYNQARDMEIMFLEADMIIHAAFPFIFTSYGSPSGLNSTQDE